ncbi:MAG: branched-chain amino acid ABC transporter permease [Betaproteobacteria bacterium]|nr:branched-chain amino acid ABC transporter permease [Betaproteobacteria bacterium]MDE2622231.1 branched-chain amino acid ABC transporter permease [Betaproteobacteria bacterium]
MFAQQVVNAISLGSVYALFALGFTLVFGILGVINLSHGGIFMLGAYAALLLITRFDIPFWVALPLAMAASGTLGLLIDVLILRLLRKRNAPHLMPMIATIGAAILMTSLAQGLFGSETRRFPLELFDQASLTWGPITIPVVQAGITALSVALMLIMVWVLRHTRIGQALRAISESPRAAALLGIPVERLFHLTSFVAAALGGAAGILIGLSFDAISPFMGQPMLHKGIAAIILGGLGDVRGAVLGGLFLGAAEVFAVTFLSSEYRDALSFGLLFLVLLWRPQGLFGASSTRSA